MRWLDYVCAAAGNDSLCETVSIGKSYEQRDLRVIKVRQLQNVLYTRNGDRDALYAPIATLSAIALATANTHNTLSTHAAVM